MKKLLKSWCQKFREKDNLYCLILLLGICFILGMKSAAASGLSDAGISSSSVSIEWPWTKFLNSLAEELTGPLPKVLGVGGIAGASMGMFIGHNGPATQRFLMLIFAVSTCLFAPSFISAITGSAGGMTIMEVLVP